MAANRCEIVAWEDVQGNARQSLLLGNGASIALHHEFGYSTLYGVAEAQGLLPSTAPLFGSLGTTDFEHVLLACWYAEHVNEALGSPSTEITKAYEEVRTGLIEAVHAVHPAHADISAGLLRAASYASGFETVVSLNYDLTLYWAMLLFNEEHGNWFKDAFRHGEFQASWEYLRRPYGGAEGATLVFYPHGNLALARDYLGEESKVTAGADDLLTAITSCWTGGEHVPIFVSEGTSQEKAAAIRRSRYLSAVYDRVLPDLGENLVVYGWGFGELDKHILRAISNQPPDQIAVSVFTGRPDAEQQAYCHYVLNAVNWVMPNAVVRFFDSQSVGCWNNA